MLYQGGPGDSARLCGEATGEGTSPVRTQGREGEKASTTLPLQNGRQATCLSRSRQAIHRRPWGHRGRRVLPRPALHRPTGSTETSDDERAVPVLPEQGRWSNVSISKVMMPRLSKLWVKDKHANSIDSTSSRFGYSTTVTNWQRVSQFDCHPEWRVVARSPGYNPARTCGASRGP